MKSFVCIVLALSVVQLSTAQDDGQYRPYLYGGDDGRYRHTNDGQYHHSRYDNNGKYASIYYGFKPFAASPFGGFGFRDSNSIESVPLATSVSESRPQTFSVPFAFPRYASNAATARILRQDQDLDLNTYHYLYQTENAINAEEFGKIDSPTSGTKAQGFYEYTGDDGVKYRVDYVADENGFRASGAHLPQ